MKSALLSTVALVGLAGMASACPDFRLPPNATLNLDGQALGEGVSLNVMAGGNVDTFQCPGIAPVNSGGFVGGYFISNPDLSVFLAGVTGRDMLLETNSPDQFCDTVLLANAPSGQWYWNDDDMNSLQSEIVIPGIQDGRLDIWVGTFAGSICPTILTLQATGGAPPSPGDDGKPPAGEEAPQPVEPQPVQPQPVQPQPVQPQPVQPQPVQPQPVQPQPVQPQPVQPQPVQPQPVQPQPIEPQPVEPQPEQETPPPLPAEEPEAPAEGSGEAEDSAEAGPPPLPAEETDEAADAGAEEAEETGEATADEGAEPADVLTVEGFDEQAVTALVEDSDLDEPIRGALLRALQAALRMDDPDRLDSALTAIRAQLGID